MTYHDEDTSNVKFDVVTLLLALKEVEGGAFGNIENGLEFELTFDGEVLDGEMVLPVVGKGFVERSILILGDVLGRSGPDGLGLVELFLFGALKRTIESQPGQEGIRDIKRERNTHFLHNLFGLLLLLSILVKLLDLGLGGVGNLLNGVLIFNLLLLLGGDDKLNRVRDEFGVLLDNVFDALLLDVFKLVLLQVKDHAGTTAKSGALRVGGNGEGTTSSRLPYMMQYTLVRVCGRVGH